MTSYLVAQAPARIDELSRALAAAGFGAPRVGGRFDVLALAAAAPDAVMIDADDVDVDVIEHVRMTRFVLGDALIAVYTQTHDRSWVTACHRSGANCILRACGEADRVAAALRGAAAHGCYTDPAFGGEG